MTDRGSAVCDRGSAVQSAGGCGDPGVGHQPRAGGATCHAGQTSRHVPGPAPPAAAGCHPGPFPGGRAQSGSTSGFLAAKVRALHLVSHFASLPVFFLFCFYCRQRCEDGPPVLFVAETSTDGVVSAPAVVGLCEGCLCIGFQMRQKAKIHTQVAKIHRWPKYNCKVLK